MKKIVITARALSLALALAVPLFLIAATAAFGGGSYTSQDVTYSYDSTQQTFTLYTQSSMANAPTYMDAVLMVDGQPGSDPECTQGYADYWHLINEVTCVFRDVVDPQLLTAVGTVTRDQSSYGATVIYTGTFKLTCRRVAARGCEGTVSVHMRAVR